MAILFVAATRIRGFPPITIEICVAIEAEDALVRIEDRER
jgi:hypothetical protein